MRPSAILAVLGCVAVSTPAEAEDALFAALAGHSVEVSYSEVVSGRRGTFARVWSTRIYISSKLRLFTKVSVKGDDVGARGDAEIGPDADGDGGRTPFRWTGTGFARQWTNRRGNVVGQTILIRPADGGFTCRMSVNRARGRSTEQGQSCRVVRGNAVAG